MRLAAFLLLASLAGSFVVGQVPPPAPAPDHQILVMLRMGPQHYRPEAGYGGAYGDVEGRSARWRVAERLAHAQGLSITDEWPMAVLSVDCFVMNLPADLSEEETTRRLSRDPAVSWSQPLHVYHGQVASAAQGDVLYRLQPTASEWRLNDLHQMSTGKGVRVAVIDSMIDSAHVDLRGAVERIVNFVEGQFPGPESHGTGVAGVIAARAGNGVGIVGVAPQARLLGLRACWQSASNTSGARGTVCDSLSLARALDFAVGRKAQVVNMSLSGPDDLLLAKLLDVALNDRIAVVAAYDRHAPHGGFPASHPGVVAVADEGGPSLPGVVSAPGQDVPTTEPGGRWAMVNGSSFSAAQVSGLFALLSQEKSGLHKASDLVLVPRTETVDACATLVRWSKSCHCACDQPPALSGTAS